MENNYKEYLESFAWKAIKQVKLSEQPECECCGESATTVHHLSYERRGSEKEDDIVSICERCHHECHFVNGYQIKNDEETLRKRFEEVRESYESEKGISRDDLEDLGCRYFKSKKYIYFGNFKIDNADILSFEVIGISGYIGGYCGYYGKDKNHVYSNGDIIEGVDPSTFIMLNSTGFSMDKNHVYIDGNIIEDLTPSNLKNTFFERIKLNHLIKDDKFVYLFGKKINGADPESFQFIYSSFEIGWFGKDKNYVYINETSIKDLDSQTFIKISGRNSICFKDKNYVLKINNSFDGDIDNYIISGADAETFNFYEETIETGKIIQYYKDKNHVYDNYCYLIPGSDSKTFKIINEMYQKDKNYVYLYMNNVITSSDGKTFEIISENYAKDKNHVYENGNIIDGLDPGTFKVLSNKYTKDKSGVYSNGTKIEGLDPGTFQIINDIYFKDKNGVYRGYKNKLHWVEDPLSFKFLNGQYSKDNKYVYFDGNKISYTSFFMTKYADPHSFKVIDDNYGKDKDNKYFNGVKC